MTDWTTIAAPTPDAPLAPAPTPISEPSSPSPAPVTVAPATVLAAEISVSPVTPAAAATTTPETIAQIIDRHFMVCLPGTLVSETTEQWNLLYRFREDLKNLLSGR
jgi:hypothetical protein